MEGVRLAWFCLLRPLLMHSDVVDLLCTVHCLEIGATPILGRGERVEGGGIGPWGGDRAHIL